MNEISFSDVELELIAYCMRTMKHEESKAENKPVWYGDRIRVFDLIIGKVERSISYNKAESNNES